MLLPLGPTHLRLLPEHAAFFPECSTLVVADLHLGKAFTMRQKGLPVTHVDSADVLAKLSGLLESTAARRLVIAGDFLHAPAKRPAAVIAAVEQFLARHALPITLTLGNHDIDGGAPLPEWGFSCVPDIEVDGIFITHEPNDAPADRPALSGHKHPSLLVRDGKNTTLRYPCFWLNGRHLVLPAFGSHLGTHALTPIIHDRYFITVHESVIELPDEMRPPPAP